NGKIGEKKAKGIIYDKILEHLIIIREKSIPIKEIKSQENNQDSKQEIK
ncbi:42625_t:CDS:2, partial [Gigaspora margarita]